MKHITLAVAALLSAGPLSADEETMKSVVLEEQVIVTQKNGKEAIQEIRKDYEAGRYDDFLKEMDRAYQEGIEEKKVSGLAHLRKGNVQDSKWTESALSLQKATNKELMSAVSDQEGVFADKVRSAAAALTTPEQQSAIFQLMGFTQMMPGTGKNGDENALIDLDLEYEYKSIHLDVPGLDGQRAQDRKEKHYVLKMERAHKMVAAAQLFQDPSLKKAVDLSLENLDDRMAQNWDQLDLQALAKGEIEPQDLTQKQVAAILQSHQEKLSQLTKEYLKAVSDAAQE